jgi:prepilin-type processing-associated H-X9-DG protein
VLALAAPMLVGEPASQPALAYAPKGATLIAHFDGPALVKAFGMAREAIGDRKLLEEGSASAKNFDALGELLAKIQSADAYVVSIGKARFPMLALHTKCEIGDFYDVVRKTDEHLPELTRLDQGKYVIKNPDKKNSDQEIFTLLDGDAIDGVGAGTILVAMAPSKLTMETVKTIGTGASAKLAKLAKDLPADAQGWLVAEFSYDKDEDEDGWPRTLVGTLYLDEGKESKLEGTFKDSSSAQSFVDSFKTYLDPGSFAQIGQAVTVTGTIGKKMWTRVIAAYLANQSVGNLLDIGMAIQRYQAQNRFKLPASLNELVKNKYITAQRLVSPASGRKLKTDKDGVPLEDGDYVYVNHGQLPESAHLALIIVAYDALAMDRGGDVFVLFADGHVERVAPKAFEEKMKTSAKEAAQKKGN